MYARTIIIAVTTTIMMTLSVVMIAIAWGQLHGCSFDETVIKRFGVVKSCTDDSA